MGVNTKGGVDFQRFKTKRLSDRQDVTGRPDKTLRRHDNDKGKKINVWRKRNKQTAQSENNINNMGGNSQNRQRCGTLNL